MQLATERMTADELSKLAEDATYIGSPHHKDVPAMNSCAEATPWSCEYS